MQYLGEMLEEDKFDALVRTAQVLAHCNHATFLKELNIAQTLIYICSRF